MNPAKGQRALLTITDLSDLAGHWTATVTLTDDDGARVTFDVDCKSGSWQVGDKQHRHDLMPSVARELQDNVHAIEKARAGNG